MKNCLMPALAMVYLFVFSALAAEMPQSGSLEKMVVITPKETAALTNRTEILLHAIRLPEIKWGQANVADIVAQLNEEIQRRGTTPECRNIRVVLDIPESDPIMGTQSPGGLPLLTLGVRDMSVLEAVRIVARVAVLDLRIEGEQVILSKPKPTPKVQQPAGG